MTSSIFNKLKLDEIGKKMIIRTPGKIYEGILVRVDSFNNLVLRTEEELVFIQRKYCSSIEILEGRMR